MSARAAPLTYALIGMVVLAAAPGAASADSFTPVRMTIRISPVARRDQPLPVQVTVTADPGALDIRSGALRARVKLSTGECGGGFDHTAGTVLLDRSLSPQPDPGEAYQGTANGSGRPPRYGVQTVCAYLQDDFKQFASDTTSFQVDVSQPCTATAARYDRAVGRRARTLAAAHNARGPAARRLRSRAAAQGRLVSALGRRARTACGPGVVL